MNIIKNIPQLWSRLFGRRFVSHADVQKMLDTCFHNVKIYVQDEQKIGDARYGNYVLSVNALERRMREYDTMLARIEETIRTLDNRMASKIFLAERAAKLRVARLAREVAGGKKRGKARKQPAKGRGRRARGA